MPILLKNLLQEAIIDNNPNFKRWFRNSKVVDNQNKPLVVYHGSPNFSGDSFNKGADKINRTGNVAGFYFTADNDEASDYSGNRDNDGDIYHKEGSSVIPVYLSIQNPYDLGFHGYDPTSVTDKMVQVYMQELQANNSHMDSSNSWFAGKIRQFKTTGKINSTALNYNGDAVQRVIMAGGYDGVIDGRHYVAFEPTQIKSIHNVGDFSSNNPNIMKEDEKDDSAYRKSWLERHDATYSPDGRLIAYHGTPSKNLPSIKKNGFKYKTYFSLRPEYSKQIASTYHDTSPEKVTVLKVLLPLDAIDFIMSDIYSTRVIKYEETI